MPTKIKAPTEGKLHPSVLGTWLTAPASGLKSTLKGQLRVPNTLLSLPPSAVRCLTVPAWGEFSLCDLLRRVSPLADNLGEPFCCLGSRES